ncbi:MAG: 3-phosphoshikimate 1-carboxyvinyltransferase [bacterium]|nr:3-phosphoshikimate 1-carboxyvinyltransferase [bacterium]MDD5756297.1 3-phosphoshikimate 1-carboxyvinyltransferase [bacterium]
MLVMNKVKKLKGVVTVPGDKSISHRAIMFTALSEGRSTILNFLESEDCLNTKKAFLQMGIKFTSRGKALIVYGKGLHGLKASVKPIDCGNSGTTMRLISGILAGQEFTSILTGDKYLRRRPMKRVITPLRSMGAKIEAVHDELAPLKIYGGYLQGIEYTLPVASAQVKSCILLAGLYADGKTSVIEPVSTRDHTEKMLAYLGANIKKQGRKATVQGNIGLQGKKIIVPGDISSAAFLLVAASIIPGSRILIRKVGINPTRNGIITILQKMGARIKVKNKRNFGAEPVADLEVRYAALRGITVTGKIIPNIIDEIPVLAVAAALARGKTVIRGAKELRVKETDRIKSMASQLKKMGAKIEERKDGLAIYGSAILQGAIVDSFGDHRTAMSLAIAAMTAEGQTVIKDTACINTSFPGFEKLLRKISAW